MRKTLPMSEALADPFAQYSHRHTRFFYVDRDQKTFVPDLEALFDLLKTGKIDVMIKHVFNLEDVQEAHQAWSSKYSL
jgi:NADPH:quinone reductase-like Zn-dependent oxidoreductase